MSCFICSRMPLLVLPPMGVFRYTHRRQPDGTVNPMVRTAGRGTSVLPPLDVAFSCRRPVEPRGAVRGMFGVSSVLARSDFRWPRPPAPPPAPSASSCPPPSATSRRSGTCWCSGCSPRSAAASPTASSSWSTWTCAGASPPSRPSVGKCCRSASRRSTGRDPISSACWGRDTAGSRRPMPTPRRSLRRSRGWRSTSAARASPNWRSCTGF